MADQQDSHQDEPPELPDLYRFSWTCLGLGIPQDQVVAGDFLFGLEGLRQRGVAPLEAMARVRATTAGESEDDLE